MSANVGSGPERLPRPTNSNLPAGRAGTGPITARGPVSRPGPPPRTAAAIFPPLSWPVATALLSAKPTAPSPCKASRCPPSGGKPAGFPRLGPPPPTTRVGPTTPTAMGSPIVWNMPWEEIRLTPRTGAPCRPRRRATQAAPTTLSSSGWSGPMGDPPSRLSRRSRKICPPAGYQSKPPMLQRTSATRSTTSAAK